MQFEIVSSMEITHSGQFWHTKSNGIYRCSSWHHVFEIYAHRDCWKIRKVPNWKSSLRQDFWSLMLKLFYQLENLCEFPVNVAGIYLENVMSQEKWVNAFESEITSFYRRFFSLEKKVYSHLLLVPPPPQNCKSFKIL